MKVGFTANQEDYNGVIKALWIHKIDFYSTGYFPRCICVDLWAENSQLKQIGTYIRHIRVFLRSRNAQMKLKKNLCFILNATREMSFSSENHGSMD